MKKKPRKAPDYIKGNGKVDSIGEVLDTTKEVGKTVGKKSKQFWTDFKKFVAKGNVVDLAVAVVVGTAFNKIVSSLVSGIITPLTSLLLRTDNLSELKLVLRSAVAEDAAAGIAASGEIALLYGPVIQAILDFLVIALSIYVTLRIFIAFKNGVTKRERLAAAAKLKEAENKKKADAEAEEKRLQQIKDDFLKDVSVQADVLLEIKDIMLRMENRLGGK